MEQPRISAPRPPFMSQRERDEYTEIHQFLRERRENDVIETRVYCRFYNMSDRDIDVIWCREEVKIEVLFVKDEFRTKKTIFIQRCHQEGSFN